MPDALAALRGLGLSIGEGCGHSFWGLRFVSQGYEVSTKFPAGPGLGLRRTALHAKMIEQAEQAGVNLWWKAPVTAISLRSVRVNGKNVSTRYVIGADGMRSRVRRWFGLDRSRGGPVRFAFRAHYRISPWSDAVELYWGRRGQAYVTPVSQQEVCVVLTSRQPNLRHDAIGIEFPELAQRLQGAEKEMQRGEITVTRSFPRVYSEHVALVGDASGTVDPITGEGLCLSFQQAKVLAEALVAGDLRRYQKAHKQLARKPALMGRLLLLLDQHPAMRRYALRALASHPALFARLVAMHIGADPSAKGDPAHASRAWAIPIVRRVASRTSGPCD